MFTVRGRTGRAGRTGTAIVMYGDREQRELRKPGTRHGRFTSPSVPHPTPKEVRDASARTAADQVRNVQAEFGEPFMAEAERLFSELGLEALSRALARIAGAVTPARNRQFAERRGRPGHRDAARPAHERGPHCGADCPQHRYRQPRPGPGAPRRRRRGGRFCPANSSPSCWPPRRSTDRWKSACPTSCPPYKTCRSATASATAGAAVATEAEAARVAAVAVDATATTGAMTAPAEATAAARISAAREFVPSGGNERRDRR